MSEGGQSLLRWTTRESAHLKGTPVTFWPGSSSIAAHLYSCLDVSPAFFQAIYLDLFITINSGTNLLFKRDEGAYIQNGLGPFKITIMLINV